MNLARIILCVLPLIAIGCSQQPSKMTTATPPATEPAEPEYAATVPSKGEQSKTPANDVSSVIPATEPKPVVGKSPTASEPDKSTIAVEVVADPIGTTKSDAPAESKLDAVIAQLEPLDLTDFYQVPAADLDGYGRGTWRKAPRNSVTLGNIPLEIGGVICLWGGGNAGRGMVFPLFVEAIPVARTFESLYLYHCTFHNSPDGTPVANVILNYDDGSSATAEILYGNHVRDWWKKPGESDDPLDPKSQKVFRELFPEAEPGQPEHIQFFLTEIQNPQPTKNVVSIDLVSAKEQSASCMMAITTGPKDLLKVDPNRFKDEKKDEKEQKGN